MKRDPIPKAVADCYTVVAKDKLARRATKYLSPILVVKVSARLYGGKRIRELQESVIVTVGKPNHRERIWIKAAKKAKEPFPVKRIQVDIGGAK